MEFIETITLKKETYDNLKKDVETYKMMCKCIERNFSKVAAYNSELKDYIFNKFMKDHKYTTNGKTFEEWKKYYFHNGFREYDELLKILGEDTIDRKIKGYFLGDKE